MFLIGIGIEWGAVIIGFVPVLYLNDERQVAFYQRNLRSGITPDDVARTPLTPSTGRQFLISMSGIGRIWLIACSISWITRCMAMEEHEEN
jgi:hypothetical protein